MTDPEPQLTSPPPPRRFQFRLRTLLLLFVVLGSSMAVFGGWGIVVFGLVVGLGLRFSQHKGLGLLPVLGLVVVPIFAIWLLASSGNAIHVAVVGKSTCFSNLRQIAKALNDYRQATGHFPPPFVADANGKPMYSWRVLILPYMDYAVLYRGYDLTKPWDGPKNLATTSIGLPVFTCLSDHMFHAGDNQTDYVALLGPNGEWPCDTSRAIAPEFIAGSSSPVMLVEVLDSGVAWAEPKDLPIQMLCTASNGSRLIPSSNHGPTSNFFWSYEHCAEVHVALADGSVHCLPAGCLSGHQPRTRPNWPNIAALAVWLLSVGMLLVGAVRSRKARPEPPPPAC